MPKVVRLHEIGEPEVLKIERIEVPPPGKGEVQIRIHALGLNRAESMFRRGEYLEDPKLPARLGYEAAGTVAAIGPGVQGPKIGDAVSVIPSFSSRKQGQSNSDRADAGPVQTKGFDSSGGCPRHRQRRARLVKLLPTWRGTIAVTNALPDARAWARMPPACRRRTNPIPCGRRRNDLQNRPLGRPKPWSRRDLGIAGRPG